VDLPQFRPSMPNFTRELSVFGRHRMPSQTTPVARREIACAAIAAPAAVVEELVDAGGVLEVLDPTGHFEVHWGRKKTEVEIAEKTFYDLLSKGYLAFKKTWRGRKGARMETFDPKAGTAIFDKPEPEVDPKKLPIVEEAASEKKDEAKKAEIVEDDEDESEFEQTREFDKKGKHVMTPPMRGG